MTAVPRTGGTGTSSSNSSLVPGMRGRIMLQLGGHLRIGVVLGVAVIGAGVAAVALPTIAGTSMATISGAIRASGLHHQDCDQEPRQNAEICGQQQGFWDHELGAILQTVVQITIMPTPEP